MVYVKEVDRAEIVDKNLAQPSLCVSNPYDTQNPNNFLYLEWPNPLLLYLKMVKYMSSDFRRLNYGSIHECDAKTSNVEIGTRLRLFQSLQINVPGLNQSAACYARSSSLLVILTGYLQNTAWEW